MTAGLRRLLPGAGVDRTAVAALTAGHVGADLFLGALPALIPFLVARHGIGYADAGLLVLAGSLASAILQPVAGIVGDRLEIPWLPPVGLALACAGLVAATSLHDLTATAIALLVGGVGVAVFHPEAVRATRDAGGASPGAALGLFAVGGTLGFALGPALTVPLAAAFGLATAGAVGALPLLAALALVASGPRRPGSRPGARRAHAGARDVRVFVLATAAAAALSGFIFGAMAFVPIWLADGLDAGVRLGSAVVAAMLVAGALGTYIGGRLSDARGRRIVIAGSLGLLVPLAAVLPLASLALALPLLIVIGLAMDASYYPLLATAQDALPDRGGLASGVVLGASVGVGTGCTALLGHLADTSGPRVALWGCAALAALALALAALTLRAAAASHDAPGRSSAASPRAACTAAGARSTVPSMSP
jgi:MFS transporter, FSR family, fosmidomycin resistance protein